MSETEKKAVRASRGYRVVDQRDPRVVLEDVVVSNVHSPEEAARQVLGMNLTRSGKPRDVRARVYFHNSSDALTMVRLYRRVDDPE